MAAVSTYLNFAGQAEEALAAYAAAFGTAMTVPVVRFGDMPPGDPAAPGMDEDQARLVAHAELPILAGHVVHATDIPPSMGPQVVGNTTTIHLELDTEAEVDRLFAALSEGGSDIEAPRAMPWGYWGVCLDRFGIRWMFSGQSHTG